MSQRDSYSYYAFTDDRIVTTMLDPTDGMSKSAITSMTSYSYTHGCAEILLQQAPVFLSDAWNRDALTQLQGKGISSLWFEGTVLYCNDSSMTVKLNKESDVVYTLKYVN